MTVLLDQSARTTALTDLNRSLLVEAGAGSGKTSLLAGRITSLLASGTAPRAIAAVSFTEMAASELMGRIRSFIDRSLAGNIPPDLASAFPAGLADAQRRHLQEARHLLGELTCTTIHGFCQRLLKPYPVEAAIDPGARILDPISADMLFQDVFDVWLRERLSETSADKDLLTAIVSHQPDRAVTLIRELADLLRSHRDATPGEADIREGSCADFIKAVAVFKEWLGGVGFEQEETRAIVEAFSEVSKAFSKIERLPDHLRIMVIVTADLPDVLVKKSDGEFRAYKVKGKWQKLSKADGARLNDEASELYERCCDYLRTIRRHAAACGLSMLVDEIRPLIERYQEEKRQAAVLDFDDLLISTRDMLRSHPVVREELGKRFSRILVDEFQDTDPVQTEIFRHLSFDPPAGYDGSDMSRWIPRPGAIFLVGDPKQAIYRFRGADVRTYLATRDALRDIDPSCILEVGTNFRSCEGVLSFVNNCFQTPLSAGGQPGFGLLNHHRPHHEQGPCVLALPIEGGESASHSREIEAKAVADLCSRLLGGYMVVDPQTRELRQCEPGDIALLAPTGTELWRYEAALEEAGIAVATQAGKGMFQRQEIQDLIAITRVLADPRDTLALGALLRGPLVGLTDEDLLDISHALPPEDDGSQPYLRVSTDPADIANPLAADIIGRLAKLRRGSRRTTPYDILSQAVEALHVRPILLARYDGHAERALANVDRYLEMSRAYSVRGVRAFSDAMRRAWEDNERMAEGRPDAEEQSVSLITMHSAKGLEWPVVIPVNTMTEMMRTSRIILDVATRRLSMPFLDLDPEDYVSNKAENALEQAAERVRIWYVAATRARDLLVMPRFAKAGEKSWARIVEFGLDAIPEIDVTHLPVYAASTKGPEVNVQDEASFGAELERINERRSPVIWRSPSRHEPSVVTSDRLSLDELIMAVPETDPFMMITGSRERGVILHKLMEEVLTGETDDDEKSLAVRSSELIDQFLSADVDPISVDLKADELAHTVVRTLAIPQIAEIRHKLLPEIVVARSAKSDGVEEIVHGVTDAVTEKDGSIDIVIDWKSDVRPDSRTVAQYRKQVTDYVQTVGASKGLIVFMTSGETIEIKG